MTQNALGGGGWNASRVPLESSMELESTLTHCRAPQVLQGALEHTRLGWREWGCLQLSRGH